jgi:hypothetical protein
MINWHEKRKPRDLWVGDSLTYDMRREFLQAMDVLFEDGGVLTRRFVFCAKVPGQDTIST